MISVSVIPIVRGLPKDTLSYFSSFDIREGDLVVVMIGSREVTALVVEVRPIETTKLSLKKERFKMKKVIRALGPSPFSSALFTTAKRSALHFLTSTSSMLGLLLPLTLIDETLSAKSPTVARSTHELPQSEKCVLELPTDERRSLYRTLVREAFARNESCMIIAPTIIECIRIEQEVARGIGEYVYTLHSQLANPVIKKMIGEILSKTHPVLIIATPSFSTIPRRDLRTIILERESSSDYRTFDRNQIDWRVLLEILAEELHVRFILADTLLRFETLYRHQLKEFVELRPLTIAPREQKTFSIVNMLDDEATIKDKNKFKVFSSKTGKQIADSLRQRKHVFVLTHRKGLATTTLCQDCGHICACGRCGSPLVLYTDKIITKQKNQSATIKKVEERYFMCNRCRIVERANFACPYCKSWNLKEYGLGNERIIDELKKDFGDERVFPFDQSTIKTIRARELFIKKFYETEGGILVGTEQAIPYLKDIATVVVVSIDSMFSLPIYVVVEKALRLILLLRALAIDACIVQTRAPDNKVLTDIERSAYPKIIRDDLEERKELHYSPFVTTVRFIFKNNAPLTDELIQHPYVVELNTFAFNEVIRGKYISGTCVMVRIPTPYWEALMTLPPSPESMRCREMLIEMAQEALSTTINPEGLIQ